MKKRTLVLLVIYAIGLTLLNLGVLVVKRGDAIYEYVTGTRRLVSDPILSRPVYKDLVEEYEMLNSRITRDRLVVFAGDSITRRFRLCEYFQGRGYINRGIFQDTTLGFLKRISNNINNLNVEKLFILIGYNDLRYRDNPAIVKNIRTIMQQVNASHVYMQSILPTSGDKKHFNSRIIALNDQIRLSCRQYGHTFIDLHSHFTDSNGCLKWDYSRDGVHLNGNGYQMWQQIIESYLAP